MPITGPNFFSVSFPMFQPALRNILSITQAVQALITTTYDGIVPGDHQYGSGLKIRFIIPEGFGMEQLHNRTAIVEVVNDTQFLVNIDTSNYDPFVVPDYNPGHYGTPAQVVPHGEVTEILTQATRNVLPYP